jgi:hypothetical protein
LLLIIGLVSSVEALLGSLASLETSVDELVNVPFRGIKGHFRNDRGARVHHAIAPILRDESVNGLPNHS